MLDRKRLIGVARKLRYILADIFLKQKVANIMHNSLTVSHIEVNNNLSLARIYCLVENKDTIQLLNKHNKLIKHILSQRNSFYKTPDLRFFSSSYVIDQHIRIERLIDSHD